MRKAVPEAILNAAAGMLEPFGIDLQALLQIDRSKKTQPEKKYLSVAEVEDLYGLGRWSLYRRIREGGVKAVKLAAARSGKVLVDRESLQTYLAEKAIN